MSTNTTTDDTENASRAMARHPNAERKVWVEMYPGGDAMIELGQIDCDKDLYLGSGEVEALHDILGELMEREPAFDDGGASEDPAAEGEL